MFDLPDPNRRAAQLEAMILRRLRHHPHATRDQLFHDLGSEPGLTPCTLQSLLEDMERSGKVRRLALNSGAAWCVRETHWGFPFLFICPKF